MQLKQGETILIQGGAGGVASFATAKHIGARVITTTSTANLDYVRGLGADEKVDYNAQDFTKACERLRGRVRYAGGDVAQKSFVVLKPGAAARPSSPPARRRRSPIAQRATGGGPRPGAARAYCPTLAVELYVRPKSSFIVYRKRRGLSRQRFRGISAASSSFRLGKTLNRRMRRVCQSSSLLADVMALIGAIRHHTTTKSGRRSDNR